MSVASRALGFSRGAQVLQTCKTRTITLGQPIGTTHHHFSQPALNTMASYRRFTTRGKSRPQDAPQQHPISEQKNKSDPEPKQQRQSLLDQMGATRNVKIAVIIFLCIYGTMETIFYAGALYRYFSKEKPAGESRAE